MTDQRSGHPTNVTSTSKDTKKRQEEATRVRRETHPVLALMLGAVSWPLLRPTAVWGPGLDVCFTLHHSVSTQLCRSSLWLMLGTAQTSPLKTPSSIPF